jgi:hypothetical protein
MRPTLKACALVSFVASAGASMSGLAAAQDDAQAARAVGGNLLALGERPGRDDPAFPDRFGLRKPPLCLRSRLLGNGLLPDRRPDGVPGRALRGRLPRAGPAGFDDSLGRQGPGLDHRPQPPLRRADVQALAKAVPLIALA